MQVALDEQIFLLQTQGGISRYFVELLHSMPRVAPDIQVLTPFRRVVNRHALEALSAGRFLPARGPFQPYPQLAAAALRPRRRGRADLVHHTFYAGRFLRDYPKTPKAVTIYDMIPELVGAQGRFGNPHLAKREYVKRADLLLCISASARDDLVATYGEPAAACVVTHLGVGSRFATGGVKPDGLPSEYVLFVGKRDGYKDFATLIKAFSTARNELRDISLVCVGGGPLNADERVAAESAGLAGRIVQRTLPDAAMPGAYANAAAFVFTSRYEGFGLPALEAMAAGTPTVLARTSSLPEVGGDAAVYFIPGDADDLAAALVGLLNDPQRQRDLVIAGQARAREFTWERTALQTAEAYRLVR